jgi:hypothetical protein
LTLGAGTAGIDYTLTFDGETNDGVLTWMEDEDYFQFGDTVNMNYQGLQNIYQQTVTVAKAGGDFTTIQGAIDYAVTQVPSTTNRFCILIHPGDYAETITGADYVELMGLAAREAVNITGATGPLYTFPDAEGHIFNLKFTLTPTTAAQTIIEIPATVTARQVVSNCLFTVTSASDVASSVFDINGGEAEFINNKVLFTNTNTAVGAIRTQRVWDVDGNAIVDLYGNIVDVDIYDVNDRVLIFDDASAAGGEIHIKENVVTVTSNNAGAYSGIVRFITYLGATATLFVAHNFVQLTSLEAGGTGLADALRTNSAGTGLIRSASNHMIVSGFATNRWANVAAGDTIVSHFDNVIAVGGYTGAGTVTYANSLADGNVNISGVAQFGTGNDMEIGYDGTDGFIRTDLVAASDLNVDCGANKTVELQTTVWRDINLGAAMLSLPVATQPDEVEIVDEAAGNTGIYTWGFAVNELVSGVFEMQHDYAEGTDITFHVHWGGNAAPTGTDYVKWQLDYTIVRDDNTINAATSLVVETAYDTQYEWIRSSFAAITGSTGGVDGGDIKIGDQFFFFFKRIAAVGDAYAGDALVATLGLHYQVNTMGSRQQGTK